MLLRENAPLREYCSMRVGGPAKLAAFPETAEELASLLRAGGRRVVLGGGSNVLFPDEGYDGTVIFTTKLCRLSADGCVLSAQAGVTLSALARKALGCGLGGLAFAYGIPGTVGGGVYMNAGAYGGQIADCLERATLLDDTGEMLVLPASELALGYRSSALMDGGLTLLSADFRLAPRFAGKHPGGDGRKYACPAREAAARISELRQHLQAAAGPFCRRAHRTVRSEGLYGRRRAGVGKARGLRDQPWRRDVGGRAGAHRPYTARGSGKNGCFARVRSENNRK